MILQVSKKLNVFFFLGGGGGGACSNLRDKTATCYGQFISKFTKLSYGSTLQKINHTNKYYRDFHPSYRAVTTMKLQPNEKGLQLPIIPFGRVSSRL